MDDNIRAAGAALQTAEDEWMALIRQQFPKQHAGDVRYSAEGRGLPGTPMRAAHDKFLRAAEVYRQAWDTYRATH